MFERFTDRARRVLVLAQEEARLLNHNFIGTEHILLALIQEGEGVAAKALTSLGVSLEAARAKVEKVIGPVEGSYTGSPPFTPRAKRVLELSLREAVGLGHNYIGTEHLLLGLVREGEGVAATVLVGFGLSTESVREKVLSLLATYGHQPRPGTESSVEPPNDLTPGLRAAFDLAVGLAGSNPVGTHHVMAVFSHHPGMLANAILSAGGFDASTINTDPTAWDVAGTLDETPLQVAARGTRIDLDSDDLIVRLTDPELAGRLRDAIRSGALELSRVQLEIGTLWHTLDQLRGTGTPGPGSPGTSAPDTRSDEPVAGDDDPEGRPTNA